MASRSYYSSQCYRLRTAILPPGSTQMIPGMSCYRCLIKCEDCRPLEKASDRRIPEINSMDYWELQRTYILTTLLTIGNPSGRYMQNLPHLPSDAPAN